MNRIVGIRLRDKGRVYYFDPGELELRKGDKVVADTAWGITFGTVCSWHEKIANQSCTKDLKAILRKITPDDEVKINSNHKLEQEALSYCLERIAQKTLNMKLVDSEHLLDGSKLIFYFTADERIDFRELVKDLANRFRVRIEMKQVGVRDEARMFAGFGCCGRQFCCSTFLSEFEPVTIRMARSQDMTLNPTKISGVCGRLMCCIAFEYNAKETNNPEKGNQPTAKTCGPPDQPGRENSNVPADGEKTRGRRKRRRNRKREGGLTDNA